MGSSRGSFIGALENSAAVDLGVAGRDEMQRLATVTRTKAERRLISTQKVSRDA